MKEKPNDYISDLSRKVKKEIIYTLSVMFMVALLWAPPVHAQDQQPTQNISDTLRDSLIRINEIYIIGNEKTKKPIITRELKLEPGEVVYASELEPLVESSRNNVYNTNLFSTVDIEVLMLDSATVDLLIKVKERWYLWPAPVFKLTDESFNDWWYNRGADLKRVKYGLKLHQYNVRGRNERLKLVGLFGFERLVEVGYRIPYIEPSQRHGINLNFAYTDQNNLAYHTADHVTDFIESRSQKRNTYSGTVIYSFRNSYYNYHYGMLNMYTARVADTIAYLNPNYFGDGAVRQRAFKLSYTFARDTRDNRNYPLKGTQVFANIEKVGLGIFDDVDFWRFTINYEDNFDLGKGFYFSTNLAGEHSAKDVPYFNYLGFGTGNYYVRGYDTDVNLEGYQNLLTKNNLKKLLFKGASNISRVMPIDEFQHIPYAFYGKIFIDVGWINNYPFYEQRGLNNRLTNRFLYGIGVGLDIVTLYDFAFRLEYSYNAENQFNLFINFQADL